MSVAGGVFGAFSDGKHLVRVAEIIDCGRPTARRYMPKNVSTTKQPS
jgi:hypothetical protein